MPQPHSFKPFTPCSEGMEELLVDDLIVNRQWDRNFVQANFLPVDQDVIFSIPLAYGMSKDRWTWHFDSKGNRVINWQWSLRRDQGGSMATRDRRLWKLRLSNKIKNFIWLTVNGALPCFVNLKNRGVPCEEMCKRCLEVRESICHALWDCLHVLKIWDSSCVVA